MPDQRNLIYALAAGRIAFGAALLAGGAAAVGAALTSRADR
jgi:hypothetical protein